MHVIHVSASNGGGGAGIAASRLHKSLVKKGHYSVMLLDRDIGENESVERVKGNSDLIPRLRNGVGRLLITLVDHEKGGLRSVSVLPSGLPRVLNKRDGIIHLHWVQGEMMSIEEIGRIKGPLVWTLHDGWPISGAEHIVSERVLERIKNDYVDRLDKWWDLDRWCFQRKQRWKIGGIAVAPSRWMSDVASGSSLMSNWEIEVIPNIVEVRSRGYSPVRMERLGVFRIACGSASERDGKAEVITEVIDTCIEASAYMGRDLEVIRVGARENKEYRLSERCRVRDIEKNSVEMGDVLSYCDCFISGSRLESFGLLAAEAQACGVPVICWKTSGLKDVVVNGETGFLINMCQRQEMVRKILWLESYTNEARIMGQNAKKRAARLWSAEVVCAAYERVYERVLAGVN